MVIQDRETKKDQHPIVEKPTQVKPPVPKK